MKKIILIAAMLLAVCIQGRAQKIYSCQYKNEAGWLNKNKKHLLF